MEVSIRQCGVSDLFYVKKYLKRFNKWKDVNKNIIKYLNLGVIFYIFDEIKKECTGVAILINEDNQPDGIKYCYAICYQIDSINIGKIQQQTLFSFCLKYSGTREYIINIPGDRNNIESNRLKFGYANNYYLLKTYALTNPFFRALYVSIAEPEGHIDSTLSKFCCDYNELKYHYHITPNKYVIDYVKRFSTVVYESCHNLIYLRLNEDLVYEVVGFWSLASKSKSSEENRAIFYDVKNFLKTLDRNFIFSTSVIRGEYLAYSKSLMTVNKYISSKLKKA